VSIASATQLTVLIPASDIAAPGLAEVSVVNAGPGGGTAAAALAVAAPPTAVPTPTPTATPTPTPTLEPIGGVPQFNLMVFQVESPSPSATASQCPSPLPSPSAMPDTATGPGSSDGDLALPLILAGFVILGGVIVYTIERRRRLA